MKIIALANKKGGVAKSTTTITMAAILQQPPYNKRVLVIDADPQCNTSDTYEATVTGEATLYDALLEKPENRLPLTECIQHTSHGYIIPGDPKMSEADVELSHDPMHAVTRLRDAMVQFKENHESEWDYVLIDTAPAVNTLLYNILIACDEVIIPTSADRYGEQSVASFMNTFNEVKSFNPSLKVKGIVLTRCAVRTNLEKALTEDFNDISEKLGTRLFKTKIREGIKVREAQTLQRDIYSYAKNSTPGRDYQEFVKEYYEMED